MKSRVTLPYCIAPMSSFCFLTNFEGKYHIQEALASRKPDIRRRDADILISAP
jgi:hypothetical protein